MKKLILIDGNSIGYRAFFALPLLSTKGGQYTNAVFGFTTMLLRLLEEEQPTHVAVAFDKGKVTFRHSIFKEYKGTRDKTPSELREQFDLIRQVVYAFGIQYVELEGYEADDLIGTISKTAETEGFQTLIVSGDKDLLQLVDERVHAMLTRKGVSETEYYDPAAIFEKYGLSPEQIVDLKGLMGDSSDNIPGIPGVGEKTALKLLHEYGTVESVLEHANQVSGKKLQEKLVEHRNLAIMSKKLATIERNAPVAFDLSSLTYQGYDTSEIRELFKKLEFRSLLDKMPAADGHAVSIEHSETPTPTVPVRIIASEDWDLIVPRLGGTVSVQLDPGGAVISNGQEAFYWTFEADKIPELLGTWLESQQHLVTFDLKSLVVECARTGIVVPTDSDDVLLAAYLLNPSDGTPSLADVVSKYLGWGIADTSASKIAKQSLEERLETLAIQGTALVQLRDPLITQLEKHALMELYRTLEIPLTFVLARMEIAGVKLDVERIQKMRDEFSHKLELLTAKIYELAGTEFNINSPKQMGEILFDKLGLPAQKKTKTGYSTSADVLEKLAPYSEIVQVILDYRQLGKLQSTYVEGLLKVKDPVTHKVHTSFNQALTATGRLSSTEPNLQNIPIRLPEGRKIRQAFIPSFSGWRIMAADYSQIELRILAHISRDEALMDAFIKGLDIHARTASDVFEVPLEQVDSDMRRAAKAVNFGIVYGISDYGLSQNLNITRKQAGEFIEQYFQKFPGVKRFMEEIVEEARRDGYVTTLLQRRRYLPEIHASNFNIRSFAERTAMNTPIQGSAADIIKLAMVRVQEQMDAQKLSSRMLLQVHDELIFEVPPDELEIMKQLVRKGMEQAVSLSVPLVVDIHEGDTWYEAK